MSSCDLDVAPLARWLEAHLGWHGPVELRKFSGGQSNPTYALTTSTGSFVLRRKPFGQLLPSAHAIDREYQVQSALRPLGFPVPRTLAYCDDAQVIGVPFYLMSLVEGANHVDGTLPGLSKDDRRRLYESMTDTLAQLHRIDPAAAGLSAYGRPGNYFERQVKRWISQYRASETDRLEDVERLIAWLPTTLPEQSAVTIVHGDFRIDNLILDPVDHGVRAVLDWELSTLGDPLSDFSYYLMSWVTAREDRPASLGGIDLESLGIPSLEATVARYCDRTGRSDIDSLDWYFAFNQFRLVGIAQGIKKRQLDGIASSTHADEIIAQIPSLASQAWHFAQRAGA